MASIPKSNNSACPNTADLNRTIFISNNLPFLKALEAWI